MPIAKQPRSSARKSRNHGAWITLDGDKHSHECHVLDISAEGAKLAADIDAPVGSRFRLSITPNASMHKPCTVVWRRGRQIGVTFQEQAAAPKL